MSQHRQPFKGRSKAFHRFQKNASRTRYLLDASLSGAAGEQKKVSDILLKFADVKTPPGPKPKDYKPQIEVSKIGEDDLSLKMDPRSASLAKEALSWHINWQRTTRFHLYSILFISLWSAFETYISMLMEELFKKFPALLKNDRPVTFSDVIENRDQIVEYIMALEMERIGHFSIVEIFRYLAPKIQFSFSSHKQAKLEQLYLIRNIIVHAGGIVRQDLKAKLPSHLGVVDAELRITKEFLHETDKFLASRVKEMERRVIEIFKI